MHGARIQRTAANSAKVKVLASGRSVVASPAWAKTGGNVVSNKAAAVATIFPNSWAAHRQVTNASSTKKGSTPALARLKVRQ